jgi:hypothetical protein
VCVVFALATVCDSARAFWDVSMLWSSRPTGIWVTGGLLVPCLNANLAGDVAVVQFE